MKVSLGMLTYQRPDFFSQGAESVATYLLEVVDQIYIHNDGSGKEYQAEYWEAYSRLPSAILQHDPVNRGISSAKNALLTAMLEDGADWLFLMEDDVLVHSSRAITGYIAACEESGWQHLSFAQHGHLNLNGFIETVGAVTLWRNYVGLWSVYSRECLETCGLFDEGFRNAYEHVELTIRLAQAGFTDPRPFHAADATGSEKWLSEIPGSWDRSSYRNDKNWDAQVALNSIYWSQNSPATFQHLWP